MKYTNNNELPLQELDLVNPEVFEQENFRVNTNLSKDKKEFIYYEWIPTKQIVFVSSNWENGKAKILAITKG